MGLDIYRHTKGVFPEDIDYSTGKSANSDGYRVYWRSSYNAYGLNYYLQQATGFNLYDLFLGSEGQEEALSNQGEKGAAINWPEAWKRAKAIWKLLEGHIAAGSMYSAHEYDPVKREMVQMPPKPDIDNYEYAKQVIADTVELCYFIQSLPTHKQAEYTLYFSY